MEHHAKAFIDDMGYLWVLCKHNGLMRFEGMSDPKTEFDYLHPVFAVHAPSEWMISKFEEIPLHRAHEIVDRYWAEQIESILNREI